MFFDACTKFEQTNHTFCNPKLFLEHDHSNTYRRILCLCTPNHFAEAKKLTEQELRTEVLDNNIYVGIHFYFGKAAKLDPVALCYTFKPASVVQLLMTWSIMRVVMSSSPD